MTGSRPTLTLPSHSGPIAPPSRPGELLAVPAPDGQPRVRLRIRLPDRKLSVDIAAKSLRKAQAAIREAGADAIALALQGCLVEGDVIAEAGLSAQPGARHSNDAETGVIEHGVGS